MKGFGNIKRKEHRFVTTVNKISDNGFFRVIAHFNFCVT